MTTSNEFKKFASDCVRYATETKSAEDQKSFLELARDWHFAAITADAVEKQLSVGLAS
jgi:hypothetical protein